MLRQCIHKQLSLISHRFFSTSFSIKEKISNDLKKAMKFKESTLPLLKLISAELKNGEIASVSSNDSPNTISAKVIQKMIVKGQQTISEYEKLYTNSSQAEKIKELLEKERNDLNLLQSYLPSQYTEDELMALLIEIKEREKSANLGALIKMAMISIDLTRTTGKAISAAANKLLHN